jgi:hypothetical protein
MHEPRPNLGSFMRFANASERARGTVLRTIRTQSVAEYSPVTDYWKRMRDATKKDRRTTRDGAAVFSAAANATASKQNGFALIARQWAEIIPRWDTSTYEAPVASTASINGLQVAVNPRFIEAGIDGIRERPFLYFNTASLGAETIAMALRVIEIAYPGDSAVPTLIDVRRHTIHTPRFGSTHDVDAKLTALSEEFLERWAA